MNKFFKKTLAIAAAAVAAITVVGCVGGVSSSDGNRESKNSQTVANRNLTVNVSSSLVDFSQYKDTKTTDIYVWRGPADFTDEQWQWFKESGINTLILDSGLEGKRGAQFGSASQEEYIGKCHEYGINVIGYTNGNINTNVKDYRGEDFYSSIKGIDYTDEPPISEFEEIATAIPDFSEKYPGGKFFVCMLSGGADAKHLGTTDYREYVSGWYDTVLSQLPEGMPRVFATDIYPMHDDKKYGYNYVEESWLRSLAYLGELKLAHPEIMLHMAMQSMSFGFIENTSPRRLPSEEDCVFQAYVNMAFGFTEFSWFTYSSPELDEREFGEEHISMIDRSNRRTAAYYGVKKANELIYDLDEVMMSLSWHGVYPITAASETDSEKRDEKAIKYLKSIKSVILDESDFNVVKSISANGNVLCSQFTDEKDNEGFMFVNYGDPSYGKSVKVEAEFIDCDKIIVYRDGKASVEDIGNGKWSDDIAAGKGVFVIPYKE